MVALTDRMIILEKGLGCDQGPESRPSRSTVNVMMGIQSSFACTWCAFIRDAFFNQLFDAKFCVGVSLQVGKVGQI